MKKHQVLWFVFCALILNAAQAASTSPLVGDWLAAPNHPHICQIFDVGPGYIKQLPPSTLDRDLASSHCAKLE
jgi:hypothetical protein